MGDVHCQVCQEPWDAYGVRNGDMNKWQADLFQQGAGCPCCEGGERDWTPIEQLSDPAKALREANRSEWRRPKPEISPSAMGKSVQPVRRLRPMLSSLSRPTALVVRNSATSAERSLCSLVAT